MSVDSAAILAQTPRWYAAVSGSPFGLPYEEVADAVRRAVDGVVWRAGDRQALRLLAYALYVDAVTEEEASSRISGVQSALVADIVAELADVEGTDPELEGLVRAVLRDQHGGEQRAAGPAEGWSITLLELAAQASPGLVPSLILAESGDFVARWALQRWWPPSRLPAILDAFMQRSLPPAWDAVAALFVDAARYHVLRGDVVPTSPTVGPSGSQLVMMGVALTELYAYGQNRQLDEDQRGRWESLVGTLRAQVGSGAISRSAFADLQARVGSHNDTSLVTLILDVADARIARDVALEGDKILRRYFRRIESDQPDLSDEAVAYIGPLVINNLAAIWSGIGAGANFFDELRMNMRCDEFSYAFTYTHYLTDRRRALILCAIAAVAGKALGDNALLERASRFAEMLGQLPAGVASPFSAKDRDNILERTGVCLPPDRPLFGV